MTRIHVLAIVLVIVHTAQCTFGGGNKDKDDDKSHKIIKFANSVYSGANKIVEFVAKASAHFDSKKKKKDKKDPKADYEYYYMKFPETYLPYGGDEFAHIKEEFPNMQELQYTGKYVEHAAYY